MTDVIERAIQAALGDVFAGFSVITGVDDEERGIREVRIVCSSIASIDDMPADSKERQCDVSLEVLAPAEEHGRKIISRQIGILGKALEEGALHDKEVHVPSYPGSDYMTGVYFHGAFLDGTEILNENTKVGLSLGLTVFLTSGEIHT